MKYVVVFEQSFQPQMGVTLIDADSPEAAKQQLLSQIPEDLGSELLVTNVMPAEREVTKTVTEPTIALVTE